MNMERLLQNWLPNFRGDTCAYMLLSQVSAHTIIPDLNHLTIPGADWLQGPYIYSLYREEYGLPERLVALLFVVGYSSGGIAYPLVGSWADQ